MSSLESQLRADLGPALSDLIRTSEQLSQQILAETDYPIWVWQAEDPFHARQQLAAHILALDFADQQDPNSTLTCSSLIGVSPETLDLADTVNLQRKQVTQILRKMDTKTVAVEDATEHTSHYEKLVKVALTAYGHPRLHRKQMMRPFEILPAEPERVGFTWARIRKSERITTDDARMRLHDLLERTTSTSRQAFLQAELSRVNQLDSEEPLSVVTPPHVHPRANIVWADGPLVTRQTRRAVVPIFYPCHAGQMLPVLKPLADEPPPAGHRMKRRDVKIQDEPYLTSIRVHRYIAYAEA